MTRKFTKRVAKIMLFLGFATSAYAQTYEAEDGALTGVTVASSVSGYTGTGYVTGFDNSNDKVTVTAEVAEEGFYELKIRFHSPSGEKTQDIIVNDAGASPVAFPQTTTFSELVVGKHVLYKGENTITIKSNWGYMDVDNITITPAEENTYNITPDLIDEGASATTKVLYAFLTSQFGKKIISGQTDHFYDEIIEITENAPMIRGYDFQHYTEGYSYLWKDGGFSFGAEDNGQVQDAIDWYNSTDKNGIVTFQWHWHSPSGGEVGTNTFYTDQTTFDVTKAVQPGTQEYDDIIRDIDAIGVQLKRFQDADVPVLWRPLHEAGGGWFWWGAKGPEACLALFSIIFDRLVNHHGLHNLIWVWSSPEEEWYPGNDKIDIVGHDSYPGVYNYSIQKSAFDQLHKISDGQKIIAMTENGPIPDPDESLKYDAPWSYFMSWGDLVTAQNSEEHIIRVYTDVDVLSFGDNYTEPPPPPQVTGVADHKNNNLLVFPNPAKGIVKIEGKHIEKVLLYDMEGREAFSSDKPVEHINTQPFINGIYFLRIYGKDCVYIQKLIIEN